MTTKYEFRDILPEELDQVIQIEQICFPPNEACSAKSMRERVANAPETFMVAVDKETGKGLYPNTDATKVGRLGKIDFSTSNFGTAQTDGYVYATLAANGKYPVKVMKSNGSKYEEVLVQTSVEGNNIVICAKTAFAGYVVTI